MAKRVVKVAVPPIRAVRQQVSNGVALDVSDLMLSCSCHKRLPAGLFVLMQSGGCVKIGSKSILASASSKASTGSSNNGSSSSPTTTTTTTTSIVKTFISYV